MQSFQKNRFQIVVYLTKFLLLCVFFRTIYLQFFSHQKYHSFFFKQSRRVEKLFPLRGSILDCHGQIFALSHYRYTVKIAPKMILDRKNTIQKLSHILNVSPSVIEKKMSLFKKAVYLKRKINDKTYQKLINAKIKGVYFDREQKRVYPQKHLACHVVGFIGSEGDGLDGIEREYNDYLRGEEGKKYILHDARLKDVLPLHARVDFQREGCDVILTIDQRIQYIVEKEIEEFFTKKRPVSVSIIVMNPKNGDILALANRPSFDLNFSSKSLSQEKRNRSITDIFEPGSTFKIITFSTAFEENIISPDDKIFCENGLYKTKFRKKLLHDHSHYGWLKAREVLQKSSNIGSVKIAEKVGKKRLFHFIQKFGFGRKTGIELLGESQGRVRDIKNWKNSSLLAIPIGHEIGTTAIQMVYAMGVIANNGILCSPRIVKEVRRKDGTLVLRHPPKFLRRVISQKTAKEMSLILESVVTRKGTAFRAKIPNIRVSGKTGTAQKYDKRENKYSHKKFFSSFIGFFPVESPQYCIGVFIDEPPYKIRYGGICAASIFRKIGQNIGNIVLNEK